MFLESLELREQTPDGWSIMWVSYLDGNGPEGGFSIQVRQKNNGEPQEDAVFFLEGEQVQMLIDYLSGKQK